MLTVCLCLLTGLNFGRFSTGQAQAKSAKISFAYHKNGNSWKLAAVGKVPQNTYLVMKATAYDPGIRGCDGCGSSGLTAVGIKAGRGIAAVDPRVIPLGTELYIPGYGYALAADTGGAIQGDRIDLCYNRYRHAIDFGVRTIKVYILDYPQKKINKKT
jgi:3D (Asp-Asp-Asp) domain-containing protein